MELDLGFWISTGVGVLGALFVFLLWQAITGLRLNLYLVDEDDDLDEKHKTMFQVTAENKLRSIWKSLLRGLWRENIDITLADHQNRSYIFQIGYRLLTRYSIMPLAYNREAPQLNGRDMKAGQRYVVRSGSILQIGERRFKVMALPTQKALEAEVQMVNPFY